LFPLSSPTNVCENLLKFLFSQSSDWSKIVFLVVFIDLLGFGYSEKALTDYSNGRVSARAHARGRGARARGHACM
jgi:pimeloyl-ACP methyl ester carboxylesterase